MRELTIGKNDAGQRLDRFVAKSLPLLPPTLLQKYNASSGSKSTAGVPSGTHGWSPAIFYNYISTTSSLTSPLRKTSFSPCSVPSWTSCTKTRICCW